MDTKKQGLLDQFVSMTNTAPEFAQSFLEASEWNFENALNLYLDGGGSAATANVEIASAPQTTSQGGGAGTNNAQIAAAQEKSLEERITQIQSTQGVDYATAKAIAEAETGNGSNSTPYEDGVRAPIAATTGRLIDNSLSGAISGVAGGSTFRDFEAETRAMEARMALGQEGIGTSAAVYNRSNGTQENAESARAKNLHDLFSPPRDILFQGSFSDARAEGRQQKKWILINIQKDSVFLSYIFNRDLWSQDVIKDTIRHNFLFFQHEESDTEATQYIKYYSPKEFPHIAIVDPLTGEQMCVIDLSRFQNDPTDLRANFLERLNSFLDSNTLHIPKMKLKTSKQESTITKAQDDKTLDATENKRLKQDATPSKVEAKTEETEDVILPPEPDPNDPDAALVQIRLFDGKRLKRRFRKQDKVDTIFAYVKAEVPEARTKKFDLLSMRKSLLAHKDSTLIEQKLLNTLLTARWI